MPEESSKNSAKEHLQVKHPEGKSEKFPLPQGEGTIIKVGRELDNDLVLTDPRSSRYHAEFRRAGNIWEVRDLDSANGTLINDKKLEPDTWTKITPSQTITMAETKINWKQDISAQSTVAMQRPRDMTVPSAVPPPVAKPSPAPTPTKTEDRPRTAFAPWAIVLGLLVVLLLIVGLIFMLSGGGDDGNEVAEQQPVTFETPSGEGDGRNDGSLEDQALAGGPTSTPTPSGPQLAIPVLEIVSTQVSPIIFGASPSTTEAYIFIDVRARNAGNIPFEFSISNFSMRTGDGQTFTEAGSAISENYLKQLGAIDRFEALSLTPGGSVPGSLVFQLEVDTYDLELVFDAPDLDSVFLSLGTINMDRDLMLSAGTPAAVYDEDIVVPTTEVEPTETPEPTPTPTRPALIPAPAQVARSALAGTIAYPSFDGETYNIYFGDVESGESTFFRSQASQPAFSPDGSRIAFRSWDNSSRGLMTMDLSGANGIIVANFLEDQLPTWTADGEDIILLSRRSGDRKSNIIKVGSRQERTEGVILGEGEYPTIGQTGELVFRGWGTTAFGLRSSTENFEDIAPITNTDTDTAPAISPDGERVAFMSQREENWDIYVSDIDGSNLQRLTDDAAQDGLPTWSPDGNAIAFVSDRGGLWAVWVMTPDGKGKSQLFTMPGSADGFVGSSTSTDVSRGWAEERISWTR